MVKKTLTETDFLSYTIFKKNILALEIIPKSIKIKYYKKSERIKLFEKFGNSAFLYPETLSYPIKNFKNGQLDCRLLYYVIVCLFFISYEKAEFLFLLNKAKEIFEKNYCSYQFLINIGGSNVNIDLITLLEFYFGCLGDLT